MKKRYISLPKFDRYHIKEVKFFRCYKNKFMFLNENGKKHRLNAPAVYSYNSQMILREAWYNNGILHREDGPALIYRDGIKEWVINGSYLNCKSQEEFLKLLKLKAFL